VVVLGDFGRSPRMQYHTLSLAEQVRAYTSTSHAVPYIRESIALCRTVPHAHWLPCERLQDEIL